jgi:hypothetical protein
MEISDCYARVKVSGHSIVGGLIGDCLHSPTVANCYSSEQVIGEENVGGLIGLDEEGGSVEGCFWDIDRSGQKTSDGGTGMTTAEMKDIGTYLGAGWDIESSESNLAGGCPFLSWQLEHSPVWLIPVGVRHHHPVKPNIPRITAHRMSSPS